MSANRQAAVADIDGAQVSTKATACTSCSRRQFLSGSLLISVGALLAVNCGDGQIGADGAGGITGPIDFTMTLADYPALNSVGGIVRVTVSRTPVAIVRAATDSYLALSLVCTHEGTTVNINGNGFLCPNHGAQFNSSGVWVSSRQRTSNLHRIATTLDSVAGTLKLG